MKKVTTTTTKNVSWFLSLSPQCFPQLIFLFLSHVTTAFLGASLLSWSSDSFSLFSLVTQSCPTLCNPMNCSTPGVPVHHQLPESTHTHIHRVDDAIQPSHPLSSPSSPALNLSQHQYLFQ